MKRMNVGESLRKAMKKEGVKAKDLAAHFDVSVQTVSAWRNQEHQSGKVIDQLAEYFGMSASEFIELGE